MFQKNYFFVSVAICFLSLFIFISFRTVPVSRLWSGYQLLYVSGNEINDDGVLAILQKHGIKDVVSSSNQRIPLYSDISPVQAQKSDSYLFKREGFFTDESKNFRVFYIKGYNASKIQKVVNELSSISGVNAGTDSSRNFPWISPVICLAFALLNLFFSSNKKITLAFSIFPIILSFTRPLFTVSCSCCLVLCAFSFLINIYKRKNFLKTILHSVYVLSFFFAPVVFLFITSPVSALFFILATTSSICVVYIIEYLSEVKLTRATSFNFVYIRTANTIPMIGKKGLNLILTTAICCALIFISSLLGNAFQLATEDNSLKPALPSPVSSDQGVLPNLESVNQWAWNTLTFPYRKLDEQRTIAYEGQSIVIPNFIEKNGAIVGEEKSVFVYNSNFKNTVASSIRDLEYPAIEKVLVSQGKNTEYGYTKNSGSSYERFGNIVVIVLTMIPVLLALYYVIGRRRYGLSI